jgi:hypothetical protein
MHTKTWREENTRKSKDNIKMDKKIGREVMDWIHLAQNKVQWRGVMNTVINI